MTEHYLKGAKWTLKNDVSTYEGILDDQGSADLKNIALGKYDFIVSKDGYQNFEDTIIVSQEPFDIKVDLEPVPKKKKRKSSKKKQVAETDETVEGNSKNNKTTKKTTRKRKSAKKEDKTETATEESEK